MTDIELRKLVCYGREKGFYGERDEIYVTNRLLEIMQLDETECTENFSDVCLPEVLNALTDNAVSRGLCEDGTVSRDLFDTKLMGAL